MAGLDPTAAQDHLTAWLQADLAVATGQSYTIGGRTLTRADAKEIRTNILFWSQTVNRLSRQGLYVRRIELI